jgi:Flp pilus assembly protein TadG
MKTRKQSQRGNAILEFAIGFSVLWALFAGVYEFGYTFFVYNQLMTAVSNGAALGSKLQFDTANTANYTTEVQNIVLYGSTTAGTTPLVSGLTRANVTVTPTPSTLPTTVTVSITNFTVNAIFKSFTLNKPRVTMPYMGMIACSTC